MIDIENLTFRYAASAAPTLRAISLHVPKGDFLGIIGPSGAGKTTLMNALSGVIPHHYTGDFYGAVRIKGMDTVEHTPTDISRAAGSVFQDVDAQLVSSMVEDEILFALENFGTPKDQLSARVSEALEAVGISEIRYRALDSLSGGQKQKVAIASVLAMRPEILLLDEPTGELDPQSSEAVFEVLKTLNQNGTTIVVVEQKIMLLCAYCKSMAVLRDGQIALHGPVRKVVSDANALMEMGVHCPRVVSLHNALRQQGLQPGQVPLSVAEAEKMVREVLA